MWRVRGNAEESEDKHNNLEPSRAAEPVQPSKIGGGGNGEEGVRGKEGFNPAVVQPGQCGNDKEEEDDLFPGTAGFPIRWTFGRHWADVTTKSDFKSETIFGILSPNYTEQHT